MEISVIIPIYNLEKTILKSLISLFNQSLSLNKYEVIIVDDGSMDNSLKVLKILKKRYKSKLLILETHKNYGKGMARNIGIKKAKGEIIVLVDGDIIAQKNLLSEHLKWHKDNKENNFAMVGFITWWPKIKITPFMYWLEHGGNQLNFDNLKNGNEINYKNFYTGNCSFKKSFLIKNGLFDEDFGRNMYEDLEIAYRLANKGLKIFFNNKAVGYHLHKTNPKKYSKRMLKVGRGAKILFYKYPELKDKVALSTFNFKTLINQMLVPIFFILGKILNSQRWMGYYYNAIFFREYLKGYRKND